MDLSVSSGDDVHVLSDVSLVDDDLGGEEQLLLCHQRQHPHKLLWGIPEQSRLQENTGNTHF